MANRERDDGATRLDGWRHQTAIGDAPAAASLPRLLAPHAPSPASARDTVPAGDRRTHSWSRGDCARAAMQPQEALLFWAAAVACAIASPAGWVMGLVLALPLAPLVAALVTEGCIPRGLTVTVALAWIAVALPAPFAGWAALADTALIVAAVIAASMATSAVPRPVALDATAWVFRSALLAIVGICIARATGSPDESRATRAVRVMLWAFAILVVIEATLGGLRLARRTEHARGTRLGRPRAGGRNAPAWRLDMPAERARGSR